MSIDYANLEAMDIGALRTLAVQQGLSLHHKLSKDKVVRAIIEKVTAAPESTVDHPLIKPAAPVYNNTPEQVEAELETLKARSSRLVTKYPSDGTWIFQWVDNAGRVRREESGNLAIPMRIIKQKAANVAQGPIQLQAADPNAIGIDAGNATGKNAYTNNILLA
jgi:hypothetical protein